MARRESEHAETENSRGEGIEKEQGDQDSRETE